MKKGHGMCPFFLGSSVKCVDAFRIALTEEPLLLCFILIKPLQDSTVTAISQSLAEDS